MPAPTLREQAELTALRVLDEFQRTGALPAPLLRQIQAAAWSSGRALTSEQVEAQARAWAERLLATVDAGGSPDDSE